MNSCSNIWKTFPVKLLEVFLELLLDETFRHTSGRTFGGTLFLSEAFLAKFSGKHLDEFLRNVQLHPEPKCKIRLNSCTFPIKHIFFVNSTLWLTIAPVTLPICFLVSPCVFCVFRVSCAFCVFYVFCIFMVFCVFYTFSVSCVSCLVSSVSSGSCAFCVL